MECEDGKDFRFYRVAVNGAHGEHATKWIRVGCNPVNLNYSCRVGESVKLVDGCQRRRILLKRLYACLGAAQYKSVHVVGALIGIHRFKVHHVANDTIFI